MAIEIIKISLVLISVVLLVVLGGVAIVRSIEYVEENIYAVKGTIEKILYTVVALHAYMLYLGMPILHCLFSLSIQYAFHCFFSNYPIIKPEDPKFIYGVVGSLINHLLLIRMFVINSSNLFSIIFSFILIWVTPFSFFFTMSASENIMFLRPGGKPVKTFAGMALDWLLNLGKKNAKFTE